MANVNLIDSDTIEIEQTNNNIQMNIADGVIPTIPEIKDTYSTSQNNSYSCNYVNGLETYSTTETRVGIWLNNKPIYRKVVNFGTLPNVNIKNVNHSISNIGTLVRAYGTFTNGTYQVAVPNSIDYNTCIRTTTTQIGISTDKNLTAFSGYVVLEYTKTTD